MSGRTFQSFHRVDVLGVPVARLSTAEFVQTMLTEAQARRGGVQPPALVTYLNAACSNIASADAGYAEILRGADCVYADGQAIVWASRWLAGRGAGLPERVNAGDFIVEFCRAAAERGISIALIGGRPGVASAAAERWNSTVPDLNVAGTWDGFFQNDTELRTAIESIEAATPDIILVGMGVPLQEKWAVEHLVGVKCGAIWCVGALFEYFGEGRRRAPVWMRRAGLEWAFRLMLEPGRLWKRYLVGNVRFVARVLGQR